MGDEIEDAWVVNLKSSEDKLESEFGCIQPVHWPESMESKLYLDNGEVAMCACGNPATQVIIGTDAFCARCSDCL